MRQSFVLTLCRLGQLCRSLHPLRLAPWESSLPATLRTRAAKCQTAVHAIRTGLVVHTFFIIHDNASLSLSVAVAVLTAAVYPVRSIR